MNSSQQQAKLNLKIEGIEQTIKERFPHDPLADLKLIINNDTYELQQSILAKHSNYFNTHSFDLSNPHKFNNQLQASVLHNILSILYGHSVLIDRDQISHYYNVISFLQITSLIQLIQKDIHLHIDNYDIFELISIAHNFHNEQIFSTCIQQLEKQNFEQMKYHQQTLLHLQLPLFKLVLKSHNQFKKQHKTNISYPKVNDFISQFANIHNLDQIASGELKFQVFDITALSSTDYQQIFIEVSDKQPISPCVNKPRSNLVQSIVNQDSPSLSSSERQKGYESMIKSGELKTSNELKMQMIITFLQKKNKELQYQNNYLTEQLSKIRKLTQQNEGVHKQMKKDIEFLKEELNKKQSRQLQNKKKLSQIEPVLVKLQAEIQKKSQQLDKLVENQKNIKKSQQRPIKEVPIKLPQPQQMPDTIVQSQFLSANFIHQMFSGPTQAIEIVPIPVKGAPVPKKKKKETEKVKSPSKSQKIKAMLEQMDQQELEELYIHRIQFDEEPKAFKKSQIPQICKFLPSDFNKKSLRLLYRRSLSFPKKGDEISIRNRNHLLFLINTEGHQKIGGYISSPLPGVISSNCQIGDKNAFIFSLTKQKKIPIDVNKSENAISMSNQLLIGFGQDLLIKKDCIFESSTCNWPSSYIDNSIENQSPEWLAGSKDFFIKDIQIYEINDIEMQMVL